MALFRFLSVREKTIRERYQATSIFLSSFHHSTSLITRYYKPKNRKKIDFSTYFIGIFPKVILWLKRRLFDMYDYIIHGSCATHPLMQAVLLNKSWEVLFRSRSNLWRCSIKKAFIKVSQNSQEFLFNIVAGLRSATLSHFPACWLFRFGTTFRL